MNLSNLPLADPASIAPSRIDTSLFPGSMWKPHLSTDQTFIDDLNRALSLENRQQTYKHVNVLLLSWAENDLTDVDQEIEDLAEVFEIFYGFQTVQYKIPRSGRPQQNMEKRLMEFRFAHDNPSELMIIYYGGHGGIDSEQESIWAATEEGPDLNWSDCQKSFHKTQADILFIFDCCYAANAIRARRTGKKEHLAACGKDCVTQGSGKYTFTKRLTEHLANYSETGIPFSILNIQAALVTDATLKHSPIHAVLTTPPESITLRPLSIKAGGTLQELKGTARAMISVYFSDTVQLNLETWQKWLTTHIPVGVRNIKLEGIFESGSKLVLFSLPVYEWGYLPENQAYTFVGLITSSNLLVNPTPAPSNLRIKNIEARHFPFVSKNTRYEDVESNESLPEERRLFKLPPTTLLHNLFRRAHDLPTNPRRSFNLWTCLLQSRFTTPDYIWQNSVARLQFRFTTPDYIWQHSVERSGFKLEECCQALYRLSPEGRCWLVLVLAHIDARSIRVKLVEEGVESLFLITIEGTTAKIDWVALRGQGDIMLPTSDLFEEEPAFEEAWKYIDRQAQQMGPSHDISEWMLLLQELQSRKNRSNKQ